MVALARFLETLSAFVPLPVLGGLVGVLALVGVPTWLRGVREKQVRERARRLVRADPGDVERIADEAVRLARGDVALVRRFAAEARRLGVPRAELRALAALGVAAVEVPPVTSNHVDATAPWRAWLAVQELRAAGAEDAADRRLADAKARWPDFHAWSEAPTTTDGHAAPAVAPRAPSGDDG